MSEPLIKEFTLTHLATKARITVPLLISLYEQNAKPNFSSTSVYGRMDPIFTYQNTVRTFSVTCQTLTKKKYADYYTGLAGKATARAAQEGITAAEIAAEKKEATSLTNKAGRSATIIRQIYGAFISDLYKMMYPLYEREISGTGLKALTTNTLKSPPILQLAIEDIVGQSKSVIFVPENFSLVSGLADRSDINITIDAGDDIRYVALAGGYGFTLGGTILHEENPPGFTPRPGSPGKYDFSPNNDFPFGAGTTIDILKSSKP